MPLFVFALFLLLLQGLPAEAAGALTIDQILDIKHPSNAVWSPDNATVAFVWDEGGVGNLYAATVSGGAKSSTKLTTFSEGQVAGAFWSRDGRLLYFPHGGTLWQVSAVGGQLGPVFARTGNAANFNPSPDGMSVAFVRGSGKIGSDLYVRSLATGKETKLHHDESGIGAISWSPDGRQLLFTGGAKTVRHEQTPDYSGAKLIYTISERVPGKLFVTSSSADQAVAIETPGGFNGARWLDTRRVMFTNVSTDFKTRTTYMADAATGKAAVIHKDVDEKFWSMPGGNGDAPQASPDGKWIAFLSDRDGWDHLYVMPAQGGEAVQITKGKFEAWRPEWSHDSRRIAFDANAAGQPGDRNLLIANINNDPAHASVVAVTSGKGTNISPSWSPDDSTLLYQHTDSQHSADLWTVSAKPSSPPAQLTESMPATMDHSAFVEPEYVHFPGADGKQVPGWLFTPKNLDKTKKHPAIVWIHGDGINQNYNGWHVQRNYAVYYSFHQYLLQQGYVVFAPDYRGSIGYGRDWRQGVYMDVGGKDAKDAWMSGNYLKTLPYVDGSRIGVWGLSYGGFFTLIAMTDQPTLFRSGVDVAGVADYRMYYEDPYHGAWTVSRIGTPEQHPDVYDRASPLSHIDKLQHPLLILHGTADVNVPFLHSVHLIDEALKKGKEDLISFRMYPGEFHYFTRRHVLEDAWRRVDEFFGRTLRDSAPATH